MNPQLVDVPPARLREGQIDEAAQRWLYESTAVDGGTFTSRHGDELQLWAIFERPGDPAISPKLDRTQWSCIGITHLSYLTTLPQAVGPYAFGIREGQVSGVGHRNARRHVTLGAGACGAYIAA
ncbi:hypothetical protein [Pseudarthrobacter raffinosi]|uniref:hypothetical protein n=1 Tax=Pseudarthrobacter raffinosi TaxID=2953651 RepID=UPI00208FBBC5|nr:hypothetical protein [Pseudarthrobacter sp. MDT3-9]MCO4253240.1 hypothetical protein [Pseudarthrobacter sp. MDT3-9]